MDDLQNIQFWDSRFQKEIETQKNDQGMTIWSLSGPSFAVRSPQALICLDPYFGGDHFKKNPNPPSMYRTTAVPLNPANTRNFDAVFISHEHNDHCHEETLLALSQASDVTFYAPADTVEEMLSFGISDSRIHQLKIGDQISIKDFTVTVCPAYDPNSPGAVTYVINAGDVKMFFGGDTYAGDVFDELGVSGNLDIAMLAFGRTWYMNEPEILEAACRLKPKVLMPFHWDLWRGHTGNPLKLGRLVERGNFPFDVELLLIGDYLHYHPDGKITTGP